MQPTDCKRGPLGIYFSSGIVFSIFAIVFYIRSCSSSQKRLLPLRWCKSFIRTNTQSLASDSAIGLHLLQNPTGAQQYDDSRFSILAQDRSPFHLSALEATFIKTSNPALCRQK